MNKKLTIVLIALYLFCAQSIFSQQCKKDEFMPTVKNGAVISSSQNVLASNLTSILHQIWIPDNWEDESRIIYNYNSSGLTEKVEYESWSNGSWEKTGELIYNYNSSDQWVGFTNLSYESDGTVAHGMKWEYTYSGNKMSEEVQYMWDEDNGLWESYRKDIYTYTGDLITKTEGYNDIGDGSWELTDETTYTYDGQSREIESLTRTWSGIDNQFTNSDLTTTEYYKDNKISRWHSRSWDVENGVWSEDNFMLMEYQYDANDNCIEEVNTSSYELFGGFSFLSKSKLTHSYDGNNFLTETIDYTWDDANSQFLPIMKSEITNDSEGQPEVMIDYIQAGGEWVKFEKDIYNYDGTVDVANKSQIPIEFEFMQNYPNPFNPETTISYTINESNNVELKIYDILGNYIATLVNESKQPGRYNVKFNAADYSSGAYIYSLNVGNKIVTKKCLLIK
jgi:hypothetical protein